MAMKKSATFAGNSLVKETDPSRETNDTCMLYFSF